MLSPKTITPGQERVIHAFGDRQLFHLQARDTGGLFSLWTNITPPGGGPPPHMHQSEDECFLPLEGRVEFLENGTWKEVPVGTVVFMPRGVAHSFRNCGDGDLKMLVQITPGGFEEFFSECEKEFQGPGEPDMQRIVEISSRYGIEYIS